MEVYKRTDGLSPYWFVDAVDPRTGKRRRLSTRETDKRKARAKAAEIIAKTTATTITLGEAADRYLTHLTVDGKKSVGDLRARLDKTLGRTDEENPNRWAGRFSLGADVALTALTPLALADLKAARAREGNAPGTIAAELRALRSAVRHATLALGYAGPPAMKWGVPKVPPKLRYLDVEEAQRLLHKLHPDTPVACGRRRKAIAPQGITRRLRQDVHDLAVALMLTGGRWHEVAAMTKRQVNLTARTVTLYGFKGDKERTVPLIDVAAEVFERRLKNVPGPYVFPGRGGKVRPAPTRAIRRAMDATGLNEPAIVAAFGTATIHSLRHTYASWLRQRGLGLDEISPLLGHADIKTTAIYAKVVDAKTLDRARAALSLATGTEAAQRDTTKTPVVIHK